MTRKLINISLVLILLTATIGVSVSKHYCGGMLMEVAINSHADVCDSSGMPMDCCANDTQIFVLDEDFQLGQQSFEFYAPSIVLFEVNEVIDADLIAFELQSRDIFGPPLLQRNLELFVQVQSFLL